MFEQHLGRSVTIDQAASLLKVSRRTIYNRIREGKLQTIRTIGGSQRVLMSSLEDNRKWTGIKTEARPGQIRRNRNARKFSRRRRSAAPPSANPKDRNNLFEKEALMALLAKVVWGSSIVALALVVSSAPLFAQGRLSPRLQKHVASKSTQTVDVIVHGSPDEIRAIAARHGLSIKKTLLEGAVMQATAAGS